jgi:hypothetical protein
MKPEDRNNEFHTLRLHNNGRSVNRGDGIVEGYGFQGGDGGSAGIEGWGVTTKLTTLTQEEQLELAVDLDNIEEALRLAPDGDRERETLRKWVDRLCQ